MRLTRALFIATAFIAVVSTAQAQTATDPQKPGQAQPSPQGRTGPLNTGAGGTPPESPQGETPPNMQATSPGADEAPKGK
jgi:hypothetical protein